MTATALGSARLATPKIPQPPLASLVHIPGTEGWPLVGSTLALLADPRGLAERLAARFGPVHRTRLFGFRTITLLGPDANEFVLLDQAKIFSSTHALSIFLERLFPRGLMLLDFDEHRVHRKALAVAFKAGPMKFYLESLNRGIADGIAGWKSGSRDMLFYPAIKQLTLDLAAVSFLGAELGPEATELKSAFTDMAAAIVSFVRKPIPGTQMARGLKGRAFMIGYFGRQIDARRASDGADIFTQLCKATTDDGALLTPEQVVDHMNFLMLAAHETLASSLTSFVWFLSANRHWQDKLREEIRSLGLGKGEPLRYERLDELPLTEMAYKESLRLIPPAPGVSRCALRDTEFAGYKIPAGSRVNISTLFTHHMPELWPEPKRFDPLRFTEEASRRRHRFAFTPFGGGAHMCLGLHFAYMQAKCFAYHLLSATEVSVAPGYRPVWKLWPSPRPRDGLRVRLAALA
ncbi:MAG: cytochrome P450 [Hyphomicrobiales bacterium]|nr:cytochrome P450 [Hyphomicrobiales bacterium]